MSDIRVPLSSLLDESSGVRVVNSLGEDLTSSFIDRSVYFNVVL